MPDVIVLKDNPHHLTTYEGKGTTQFSNFPVNWEIWKCNLDFSKIQFPIFFLNWTKLGNIHCPRLTFQNPNVEFMDELGKLIS